MWSQSHGMWYMCQWWLWVHSTLFHVKYYMGKDHICNLSTIRLWSCFRVHKCHREKSTLQWASYGVEWSDPMTKWLLGSNLAWSSNRPPPRINWFAFSSGICVGSTSLGTIGLKEYSSPLIPAVPFWIKLIMVVVSFEAIPFAIYFQIGFALSLQFCLLIAILTNVVSFFE